jgi:hypothetical protein
MATFLLKKMTAMMTVSLCNVDLTTHGQSTGIFIQK